MVFALFEVSATWVTKGVSQRQSNQTEHIMRPSINKLINIVFCVFCTCAFCMQPPELPEQWISRVVHMDENLSCLGQNRWQVSLWIMWVSELFMMTLERFRCELTAVIFVSQQSTFQFQLFLLVNPAIPSIKENVKLVDVRYDFHQMASYTCRLLASLRTREAWWVDFESLARHFCELDRAELWQRAFVLDSGAKSLRADPSVRNSVWHARLTYDTWHIL